MARQLFSPMWWDMERYAACFFFLSPIYTKLHHGWPADQVFPMLLIPEGLVMGRRVRRMMKRRPWAWQVISAESTAPPIEAPSSFRRSDPGWPCNWSKSRKAYAPALSYSTSMVSQPPFFIPDHHPNYFLPFFFLWRSHESFPSVLDQEGWLRNISSASQL